MSEGGLECRRLTLVRRDGAGAERPVLDELEATFAAGQLAVVSGVTGAGKSTLLHLLAGLLRPTSGEVWAGGESVSRFLGSHRDRWRRQVGLVFQGTNQLWPDLTAAENVMLPLVPRGQGQAALRRRVAAAMDRLGTLTLGQRAAGELSVGEQQRVAVARALVVAPTYLLADEPTAHQDPAGLELVMAALTEAREGGTTVVVASHDPRVVDGSYAERHWRLDEGRLVAGADPVAPATDSEPPSSSQRRGTDGKAGDET
ncbi:MAG: ATP-binding cassette domain-containing protein [Deltaproteobacteria bacterium]|nr:ATP-binding cassette domain-containing protein [Deltaproteobacteria bacterium]